MLSRVLEGQETRSHELGHARARERVHQRTGHEMMRSFTGSLVSAAPILLRIGNLRRA